MAFPTSGSYERLTQKFLNDKVKTIDDALTGAKYIIAEYISDNAYYRKLIKNEIFLTKRKTPPK